MLKLCKQCGVEFNAPRSKIHTCSRQCTTALRRSQKLYIELKCGVCGKQYKANPVRVAHGRQTTCSRKCSYVARAVKRNKLSEYACAVCGNLVLRRPSQIISSYVFCSRTCHYRGRSLGLVKRIVLKPYQMKPYALGARPRRISTRPRIYISWTCETCGKERSIPRSEFCASRRLRFCSPACASIGSRGEKNYSWRGGHKHYYGPSWRAIRRQARLLDGYCCRCWLTPEELGQELDVHHLLPVRTFANVDAANTLDNVVSLCHKCHLTIEWHGVDFLLPTRCLAGKQAPAPAPDSWSILASLVPAADKPKKKPTSK
jgi:5-methylcytosine-specific restriction endonuclease McrA